MRAEVSLRFDDRQHAGLLLAERLEELRDARPTVLGVTRGGIPIALEVARRLGAPLDLVVVRKVGAPAPRELTVGAIAERGVTYLDPTYLREAARREENVAGLADEAALELVGRVRRYRGEIAAPRLLGRTVVVVDDFVVTGATARAAARAARLRGASRVVLAVPALAAGVEPALRGELDEVVTLEVASRSRSPRDAYERLEEVTDEAAIDCLRRAWIERPGPGSSPP